MKHYKKLYSDNLNQLKEEISLYKNEEDIWKIVGTVTNSPGNLCLHICGNLDYFFGAVISNTGYVRDRDLEFSRKNVNRKELIETVDQTIKMMNDLFEKLTQEDLNKKYALDKFGENSTIGFVLARLIAHLTYHLGQINYHRRLVDSFNG